jgi:hypothetical protein
MHPSETARLVKMLKAIDPMMSVDEDTLAAWHAVIGGYPFRQSEMAVMRVADARRRDSARDAAPLDPFDIRAEVRRIRQGCLERVAIPCPNVDPTDAIGYAAELRALKGAAMDGRMSPADAQRYAGGGLRITPGQPFRPAGELDQPQYDIRPMLTSAKEAI